MKKKIWCRVLCLMLSVVMVASLVGCSKKTKTDALVIMTEQLDGLFNPFFYTAAADGTIVAMTQIGMLGSSYDGEEVSVAYGEDEAVVTKDYEIVENSDGTVSYYFVLKNGIKFSDGHPLTMEDVLFSYYVYLDPVYTGSNTLYSTDILGLDEYRTQTISSSTSDSDALIASQADSRATTRKNELINLFIAKKNASATKEVSQADMEAAILAHSVSSGYKSAISNNPSEVTSEQLLKDYKYTLELFEKELENDYKRAQESYVDAPYDSFDEFEDEIFCFMFLEGYVDITYKEGKDGKPDYTKMDTLTPSYPNSIDSKDEAIEYVFKDKISRELDYILLYWATGSTLTTEYTAQAKEVILKENVSADGSLLVENISGIVSLGHTDAAGSKIKVNGTEYTVASGHNSDGTVKNDDEYDVLKITIDGIDPKAIWNFAITVAPQHYYGEGSSVGVDIANNQFGVEYASFDFMTKIIQSNRNNSIPMGAGAYKATDSKNNDDPASGDFYSGGVVYFKANEYFETVGADLENAKIGKIRYQEIASNNAIAALESGDVHYISPSLTTDNYDKLIALEDEGMKTMTAKQLGYGYIGINASKVKDINLRKAIMCAMNTSQAIAYYRAGTAWQICWPMSTVSWAYPSGADETDNGKDYPQYGTWIEDAAIANVKKYMQEAGVSAGHSDLKITFTIAGSTIDHPAYNVFYDAAQLLNGLGWNVTVVCDTQALTKINTGSLAVWAAAWSSALDPDLYQVYHKDSTATSTLAWGYNHLKTNGTSEEKQILDELSELIDDARETNDQAKRSELYQEAMSQILDLAVELPVYQRSVLYAYNTKVIDSSSIPSKVNPYSSPLDRIWEIEFAK